MFPVMVSAGHSTAGDVDCHSAAGMVDVASSGCNLIDWVVPGTSAGNLAEDWYTDEYCF